MEHSHQLHMRAGNHKGYNCFQLSSWLKINWLREDEITFRFKVLCYHF